MPADEPTPDTGPDPFAPTLSPAESGPDPFAPTLAPGEGMVYGSTAPPSFDGGAATGSIDAATREAMAADHIPEIPGYQIVGVLGRGGMGVVYKAVQTRLHRTVAIKMILSGEFAGADARIRFMAEAEVIARLQHPNIVQLHEFNVYQGTPYFTLEYVEGGTLARKLAGQPLQPGEAAAMAETLARAVHAAHEEGVVHRDIKPGNILLHARPGHDTPPLSGSSHTHHQSLHGDASFGTLSCVVQNQVYIPKVTDFGLAKSASGNSGLTATGAVVGTPSYMAPEQAGGGAKSVGPAADVYSVGAILYECLTGRPPFRAANPVDTVLQVLHDDPVPPRRLQSKVPRDLETICLKCLHKDPAKRYASAAALADDIGRYLEGEAILARPISVVERGVRWARRKPTAAALVAVSAVAAAVILTGGLVYGAQLKAALEDARQAKALAEQALAETDRQRKEAEKHAADADRHAKAADANARDANAQKQVVAASLQKRLDTVDDILSKFDERLANARGANNIRRELLTEVRKYSDQLVAENPDDPTVLRQAGRVYRSSADLARSIDQFAAAERYYATAAKYQDQVLARTGPDPSARDRAALAQSMYNRAYAHLRDKKWPAAATGFAAAADRFAPLVDHPDAPDTAVMAARAVFHRADALEEQGKVADAVAGYQDAVRRLDARVAAAPTDPDALEWQADALAALAFAVEKSDPDAALAAYLRGRDVCRAAVRLRPGSTRYRNNLTSAYRDLFAFCKATNRHAELAAAAKQYADDPPDKKSAAYNSARLYARAAGVVARHPTLSAAEKATLGEKYAATAVAYLTKAVDDGYSGRAELLTDRDLDEVRGRADYRQFAATLDRRFAGRPVTVADKISVLQTGYASAEDDYDTDQRRVVTVADRARAARRQPDFAWYADKVLRLAAEVPNTQPAVDGITWVVMWSRYLTGVSKERVKAGRGAEDPRAAAWLDTALAELAPNVLRPEFLSACPGLGKWPSPAGDELLAKAAHGHPDRAVRGTAAYYLGVSLAGQADDAPDGSPRQDDLSRRAEKQFAAVEAEFGSVHSEDGSLGELARKKLAEIRNLSVGRLARDMTGRDLNGQSFSLGQYRGRVTVVVFWANWCGPCRAFLPHTVEMQKRYAARPFAVIGVNADDDKSAADRIAAVEKLTWPSLYDGGDAGGRVFADWMVRSMPTVYVLDHAGVIRGRWDAGVDEDEVAELVAKLVPAAEKAAR